MADDALTGIAVTLEAMEEMRERRETARQWMVRFVLRALLANEDLERIMDTMEFPKAEELTPPAPFAAMLGREFVPQSRRETFADWLAGEVRAMIVGEE